MIRFLWVGLMAVGLSPFIVHAQLDSIISLKANERYYALFDWYTRLDETDSLRAGQLLRMKDDLLSAGAVDLAKMAHYLYAVDVIKDRVPHADSSFSAKLHALVSYAHRRRWDDLAMEIEFLGASDRFLSGAYVPSMEQMMSQIDAIEATGWSNPYSWQNGYLDLGHAFYRFGDMRSAIPYLKKAAQSNIPPTNTGFSYNALNTLGLCYEQLEMYDSAVFYLSLSLENARIRKDSAWMALITGNIGHVHYTRGDVVSARPMLEYDYRESIRHGLTGSAVNASMILAHICLSLGDQREAAAYIGFAQQHIDTAHLPSMVRYLENMFVFSKQKEEYKKAVSYADSLQAYTKRLDLRLNKNEVERAEWRIQSARYHADIQLLRAARSRQIVMRNSAFIILFLMGVLATLWIKRLQGKRRLELEKLNKAQHELNQFTRSLVEKNETIQRFRDQIAQSDIVSSPDRIRPMEELLQLSILTDEDWKRFRQLFDIVHPGFLIRLREKFNDLTPAETRLLALTKLHLPVKDMADMLGISADSIRKTRYRLRKKLHLPEDGSLEELVTMI